MMGKFSMKCCGERGIVKSTDTGVHIVPERETQQAAPVVEEPEVDSRELLYRSVLFGDLVVVDGATPV